MEWEQNEYTQGMTSESASAVHEYSHLSCLAHGVLDQCAVGVFVMICASASACQPSSFVVTIQSENHA